jgi:hypothetical protein
MQSLSRMEEQISSVMEERARIMEQRGSQMLVFGWLAHPKSSLEQLASTVAIREVLVSDTAIHKRFPEPCTHFLHAVLQELTGIVVQADQEVPVPLLRRFKNVIIEDSSSIALPDDLAKRWQGCGGHCGQEQAAIKIHVRFEIKRGQMWGPNLTDGRASDRSSPLNEVDLPAGSLYVADLGYFNLDRTPQHRRGHRVTARALANRTVLQALEAIRLD